MRYKKPFSLFSRKTQSREVVWYYRSYDEYGRRTTARSTGQTNRTLAERYCAGLIRTDSLVPIRQIVFSEYAKDWWVWDRCAYIKGKLARSSKAKPTISKRYADDMRSSLERFILPKFAKRKLSELTATFIEAFMFSLRDDEGLSPKRVNNITSCLRVMLREAKRRGLLPRDPFDVVRPFANDSRERGILTIEEVMKLFAEEAIPTAWQGNLLYRCINMLAAVSGMRQGEILAVRDEDVRDGYIHVCHSWNRVYGLLPTKTRQVRDVPVPSKVLDSIRPFLGSGGFVFSSNNGERPAVNNTCTETLYKALSSIGVSDRAERNINFHSWRHFFNSMMRARQVPTAILQRVTGHTTMEMVDHYTHFDRGDFKAIEAVQGEIFG
jgi:integrase